MWGSEPALPTGRRSLVWPPGRACAIEQLEGPPGRRGARAGSRREDAHGRRRRARLSERGRGPRIDRPAVGDGAATRGPDSRRGRARAGRRRVNGSGRTGDRSRGSESGGLAGGIGPLYDGGTCVPTLTVAVPGVLLVAPMFAAPDARLAGRRAAGLLASGEAGAAAVTCDNGYRARTAGSTASRGLADARVRHFPVIAAVSFANAAYLDAVGVAGADEAWPGGTRIRWLAAGPRNADAGEAMDRWSALLGDVQDESEGSSRLHGRASQAHAAARRTLVRSRRPGAGKRLPRLSPVGLPPTGPSARCLLRRWITPGHCGPA